MQHLIQKSFEVGQKSFFHKKKVVGNFALASTERFIEFPKMKTRLFYFLNEKEEEKLTKTKKYGLTKVNSY